MTRRKFLKFLAFAVPAAALAPAAAAKLAADIAENGEKRPRVWHAYRGEWLTMDELERRFGRRLDKNPLFRGELGIYEGVRIYGE